MQPLKSQVVSVVGFPIFPTSLHEVESRSIAAVFGVTYFVFPFFALRLKAASF